MPNNDYILRDDAINALTISAMLRNMDSVEDGPTYMHKRAAERIIAGVPAADVAPRIRCADCRYYEKRCPSEDIGWCNRPGAGCGQPDEFWCAGAELKKTNNQIEMG